MVVSLFENCITVALPKKKHIIFDKLNANFGILKLQVVRTFFKGSNNAIAYDSIQKFVNTSEYLGS